MIDDFRAFAAEYLRVVDPDYVEPETTLTTGSCPRTPDFHPDDRAGDGEPNRFCPFEALDEIDAILDSSSNLPTHTARGDGYLVLDLDRETLCREVKALRAYITGMER